MSLRASATIIGLRDPFAFSVRCLNHMYQSTVGLELHHAPGRLRIMILRTRALPERERPVSRRFEPLYHPVSHRSKSGITGYSFAIA